MKIIYLFIGAYCFWIFLNAYRLNFVNRALALGLIAGFLAGFFLDSQFLLRCHGYWGLRPYLSWLPWLIGFLGLGSMPFLLFRKR